MSQRVKKLPSKGKGEDGTQTMSKSSPVLSLFYDTVLIWPCLRFIKVQKESAKDSGSVEGPKVAMEAEYCPGTTRYSRSRIRPRRLRGRPATSPTSKVLIFIIASPRKPRPRYFKRVALKLTQSDRLMMLVWMSSVVPERFDIGNEVTWFGTVGDGGLLVAVRSVAPRMGAWRSSARLSRLVTHSQSHVPTQCPCTRKNTRF